MEVFIGIDVDRVESVLLADGWHQVKEHTFIVVVDGTARIETGGEKLEADAGTLVAFEPDERRIVASDSGAKILLLLAPWPGEGHYRGGAQPPG